MVVEEMQQVLTTNNVNKRCNVKEVYTPSGPVGAAISAMTLVGWFVRLVEELIPAAEFGEAHCCGLYGTLKPAEFRSAIGEVPLSVPTGDAGYGDC